MVEQERAWDSYSIDAYNEKLGSVLPLPDIPIISSGMQSASDMNLRRPHIVPIRTLGSGAYGSIIKAHCYWGPSEPSRIGHSEKGKLQIIGTHSHIRGLGIEEVKSKAAETTLSSLTSIVTQQKVSGEWELSAAVKLLPKNAHKMLMSIPGYLSKCISKESIWSTIIMLAYLREHFNEKHDIWILVEQKAMNWICKHGVTNAEELIAGAKI